MKQQLRVFLLAVSVGLLSTINAQGDNPNTFFDPVAGFSLRKPSGWQFVNVNADRAHEKKKRIRLSDDELKETIRIYDTTPLVTIKKYAEPYEGVNPHFKVNLKFLDDFDANRPEDILSALVAPLQTALKDMMVIEGPVRTEIDFLAAAYVKIHYTLQTQEGKMFPVRIDMWVVPRGRFFFLIGSGLPQDAHPFDQEAIQQILASIQIEKKQ